MNLKKEVFLAKLKEVLENVEGYKFESATIMFSNDNPQPDGTTYEELDISWNNKRDEFEIGTYKEASENFESPEA